MPRATDLLREDHNKVKKLFKKFEDTEDEQERREIAKEAIKELEIHAQIEEEIFYPALREQGAEEDTMDEADEEHHVAEMLMQELKGMRSGGSRYAAKFTVLAENVKHHIQEEESEILTKAAEAGEDFLQELGEEMEERKMELMASYGKSRSSSSRKKSSSKRSAAARSNGRTKGAAATRVSATRKKASTKSAKKSGTRRKSTSRSR